jgi:hypothetical protein
MKNKDRLLRELKDALDEISASFSKLAVVVSKFSSKDAPEGAISEEDWMEATEHLQKIHNVRKFYAERHGIYTGWGHVQSIMTRYLDGEKTKELYDEIRKLT